MKSDENTKKKKTNMLGIKYNIMSYSQYKRLQVSDKKLSKFISKANIEVNTATGL